jgi:hypothetical protein
MTFYETIKNQYEQNYADLPFAHFVRGNIELKYIAYFITERIK